MHGYSILNGQFFGLIALVCAIWVIYDVFTNQKSFTMERKIVWTVFAIFFSIITAIVYFFTVKKKKF